MVSSLSYNIKSQIHSRVSECDGRPPVQVKSSAVNRMVAASAGVQTVLSQVVHSSCRSICHSSEPQTSTLHVSCPRPKCLGHRCSELKLDRSHCLYLPSDSSPSQGDPNNHAMPLPHHCKAPGWFWDLVQLSTEIPLQLPVSTTLLKQSHNYVFQVKVALFEKWCRENSVDFSTPSVKQIIDFFMYLYQDLNRCPSTIDGYRTAIVDTSGPAGHHIAQSSGLHRLLSSFRRDRPKMEPFCCSQ